MASNFIDKLKNPIWQTICLIALFLFFLLADLLSNGFISGLDGENFAWMTSAMCLFLFILGNAILSLSSTNPNQYWFRSIVAIVFLLLVTIGIAYLHSGNWITDLSSYRNIIFVLSITYLILISIIRFIRLLLEYAEQEKR
jgi:hypothetical protein